MAEEKLVANIVPPFAMTEGELSGIAAFAHENGLDEIGKLIAELKTLRREYLELSKKYGTLLSHHGDAVRRIIGAQPQPEDNFAQDLKDMTNATPKS